MKLRRIRAGQYETTDGAYRIEEGTVDVMCDNPHPGCPGNEWHEHTCWVIRHRTAPGVYQLSPWASPSPDTLRDAREWLASHIEEAR